MLPRSLSPLAAARAAVIGLVGLAAAPALADSAYSDAERQALREEIRKFLLEEPQILEQMIAKLREDEAKREQEAVSQVLKGQPDAIFNDGYSFVGGNPDGDVTLVEFLDYRCGYCKRVHDDVNALLKADGNIRYVVKEFPILGPESQFAGAAALAALQQKDGGLYKAFHDAMMEFQGPLDPDQVKALAAEVGLDVAKLEADMESPEVVTALQQTFQIAEALQIRGTPAFIIGEQVIRGAVPQAQLAAQVAEARANR